MGLDDTFLHVRALSTLQYRPLIRAYLPDSAIIAAPIAVYYLVLHHLPEDKDDDDKDDDRHPFDRYWKARLISLAVWVAVMLLVFVPMHLWKRSVRRIYLSLYQVWLTI